MMRKLLLAAVMFGLASGPALSQNAPKKVGVLINGGPSPLYESIKKNFLTDFSRLGYAESDIIIEPALPKEDWIAFPHSRPSWPLRTPM